MSKTILIVLLMLSLAIIVFFIANAIATAKKNKAKDAANAKIFLAGMEKEFNYKEKSDGISSISYTEPVNNPSDTVTVSKRSIDYDTYDQEEPEETGRRLKDFYNPD